jgi:hypothetical protein
MTIDITLTFVQAMTLAIAVLGAVLGVINTWHAIDNSRVKLNVQPAHAILVGGFNPAVNFCIEVTNLSAFPVTVCDVGVFHRNTESRSSFISPVFTDGGTWPRRLEPRSSVTVYGQRPESPPGHPIKNAYARTQCGVTVTGTSGALKQIAKGKAPR